MSYEKVNVYPPVPDLERGKAFVLGTDPKGKTIIYPRGNTIVVRAADGSLDSYTFSSHPAATTVAKYAPSGFYIASADVQGRVLIWDTTQEDHSVKYEYRPLAGRIADLAWSEDSKRIVVGGESGEKFAHAFLWDSGSSVGSLDGHSKRVNSIDFKQTRPFRVVTASEDSDVGFYAGPPFKFGHLNHEHGSFVNCVRYAPDGSKFVTAGADGKCFLYDGKEGQLIGEVGEPAHKGGLYSVAWSPDSKRFITASADKTVKMWDAEARSLISTFNFPDKVDYQQLSCAWQGDHIISVSLNGDMTYLDEANPDTPKRVVRGHSKAVTALAVNNGSSCFYGGSYDGRVSCIDVASGEVRLYANTPKAAIVSLAFNDGSLVAAAQDDSVTITPVDAEALSADKVACPSQPREAAVGGGLIAVACQNHVLTIQGGAVAKQIDIDYEGQCAAVSPDGKYVAVGTSTHKIVVYDANLSEVKTLDATGVVNCVGFSPDGQWLASGDSNRNVYAFDVASWTLKMQRWKYHSSKVNSLAWSPDSKHIATGSLDTNLIVWSLEKEMKRVTVKGAHPSHDVTQVAWLDDNTVISAGRDATFRTWSITHVQ
eukprot:TRINITY_DN9992_c0_g1_i3.p1 TRINITY_DN9992_c0_g1~~TRINITY_DN9992_c0_g1_i3.p1  ORF type:complete len:597 (+),score=141.68 TRINITY_DN9992_c0_g1_i3:51-1841(+)